MDRIKDGLSLIKFPGEDDNAATPIVYANMYSQWEANKVLFDA